MNPALRSVCALFLLLGLSVQASGEVVPSVIDGGVTYPHGSVDATLVLDNPTDAHWTVTEVHTSCSCIKVAPPPSEVPPHSRSECKVAITANGMLDAESATISIFHRNDATDAVEQSKFIVHYTVADYATASADPIELSGSGEAETTASLHVARGAFPDHWDRLEAKIDDHDEHWSASTEQIDASNWSVAVAMRPLHERGIFSNTLTLHFYDGDKLLPYTKKVRAIARIQGVWQAHPASLILGAVPQGQHKRETITLTPESAPGPAIVRLEPSDPERVTLSSDTDGAGQVTVSIEFAASGGPGAASGEVIAVCSDGARIHIPYRASIAKAEAAP